MKTLVMFDDNTKEILCCIPDKGEAICRTARTGGVRGERKSPLPDFKNSIDFWSTIMYNIITVKEMLNK